MLCRTCSCRPAPSGVVLLVDVDRKPPGHQRGARRRAETVRVVLIEPEAAGQGEVGLSSLLGCWVGGGGETTHDLTWLSMKGVSPHSPEQSLFQPMFHQPLQRVGGGPASQQPGRSQQGAGARVGGPEHARVVGEKDDEVRRGRG